MNIYIYIYICIYIYILYTHTYVDIEIVLGDVYGLDVNNYKAELKAFIRGFSKDQDLFAAA